MRTIILLALLGIANTALARNIESGPGGGSGCMSEIFRAANVVASWLENNGDKLRPEAINAEDFLDAVDPSAIQFTNEDLRYQGNPVDAYFDGHVIHINCERFKNDPADAQDRVLAHEVFRKMKMEGDRFEVTRQIPILNQKKATSRHVENNIFSAHSTTATCVQAFLIYPELFNDQFHSVQLKAAMVQEATTEAQSQCYRAHFEVCEVLPTKVVTVPVNCAQPVGFAMEATVRGLHTR